MSDVRRDMTKKREEPRVPGVDIRHIWEWDAVHILYRKRAEGGRGTAGIGAEGKKGAAEAEKRGVGKRPSAIRIL